MAPDNLIRFRIARLNFAPEQPTIMLIWYNEIMINALSENHKELR